MLRYLTLPFALLLIWLVQVAAHQPTDRLLVADDDTLVQQLLRSLGHPQRGDNMPRPVEGASAELGERIVLQGLGYDDQRQSKHFVCTSCHNTVKEDADLLTSDPEQRLEYAEQNGLPFLPGTTLYGVVNRESYYNGDYEKKYGDLVKAARKDLRGAVQLCATACAQGRPLSILEMESVIAYLNTIGLKVKDLALDEHQLRQVNDALAGRADQLAARQVILKQYAPYSPATFVLPPENRKEGYPETGRPEKGAVLYEKACLHCHEDQRYSFFELNTSELNLQFLLKHFPRYTRYSTYQVVRYGTSPIPGKKAYMPHYTAERMSDRQVEDLRAYLAQAPSK